MSLSYLWVAFTALVIYGALGQYSSFKTYTGYRLDPLSVREIYYYDLVIAIVEINKYNKLINCEIVEIDQDDLREELMNNLTSINTPVLLTLDQMLTLMNQCNQLDPLRVTPEIVCRATRGENCNNQTIESNGINEIIDEIISGIIPGTKWCGRGDLATMYFDLGPKVKVDVCCRAHDLCPSKIVQNSTRYNLTSNLEYTSSHCSCGKMFANCLKSANDTTGDTIGYIFFNILGIQCIDEKNGKMVFESPPPY